MPSSITRLTALDHDRMLRLARRAVSPGPSQHRWRDELVHLVRAHLAAEQEVLSAEALKPTGDAVSDGLEELHRIDAELRQCADEMAGCAPGSVELRRAGEALASTLTVHADALNEGILRPLEDAVARKEVRRLGGLYADRRDQVLHEEGEADPPPRRLDLSRAELYELAKKAGIAGRSAMSRKDLIAELQRRQQTS
jgi:hypothetical protein